MTPVWQPSWVKGACTACGFWIIPDKHVWLSLLQQLCILCFPSLCVNGQERTPAYAGCLRTLVSVTVVFSQVRDEVASSPGSQNSQYSYDICSAPVQINSHQG